jgi:tRNA pseudouridine55 synthase
MGGATLSGILNINKPAGMTSHDVVNQVRKLTRVRKVGHTGTLDPMATGVLLVCLGQATRLIEYMMSGLKRYRATIWFGRETNTYDLEGEVVAERDPSALTEAQIRQALAQFIGTIRQVPPAFSAIKRQGVPLYKLARQGIKVQPEARQVQIDAIDFLGWQPPYAEIEVTCHAGTYIRSLAHDLGQSLGVGGSLSALSRTANGPWQLADAVSLADLKMIVQEQRLSDILQPVERGVIDLPRLVLDELQVQAVRYGQAISFASDQPPTAAAVLAAFDKQDSLVAILAASGQNELRPKKVFHPEAG